MRKLKSIREEYVEVGVTEFYQEHGSAYRNPHEASIAHGLYLACKGWSLNLLNVLDLACGSGEATIELAKNGATNIDGVDPYTGAAYFARTGKEAMNLSFENVANGALEDRQYTLIVCSYALHLLDESRLPLLCYRLSQISPALVIVTPHKRPKIRRFCWNLFDEFVYDRVRLRYYRRS